MLNPYCSKFDSRLLDIHTPPELETLRRPSPLLVPAQALDAGTEAEEELPLLAPEHDPLEPLALPSELQQEPLRSIQFDSPSDPLNMLEKEPCTSTTSLTC